MMKVGDLAKYKKTEGTGLIIFIDWYGSPSRGIPQVHLYYTMYDPPQIIWFDITEIEVVNGL